MSLQAQARQAGGEVNALLGIHEVMILCAWKFRDALTSTGTPVISQWRAWGGIQTDLDRMSGTHTQWLANLPAMAIIGDTLLVHADTRGYRHAREPGCRSLDLRGRHMHQCGWGHLPRQPRVRVRAD